MTRRVLITGGAGFIGSRLAESLARRGDPVVVLDALVPQVHGDVGGRPDLPDAVEFIRGDVCDAACVREALAGATDVVHLAALTGTGQSMYEVEAYVRTNVLGTAVLLDAVAACRGARPRVVLASSRAVYGEGACRCPSCGVVHPAPRAAARLAAGRWEPVCPRCGAQVRATGTPEDLAPDPASIYGATKWQQEILLATLARSCGLAGVALRFQNVYGAGQSLRNPYTGILPLFVSKGLAGEPMPLYEDGGMTRDFVHVDDAVRALLLALDRSEAPGGVYNVGAGRPVTLREVAREVAGVLGVVDGPAVTGKYRLGDVRHACADLSRASRELGFRPEVPFADGVRELVAWARTQPAIGSLGRVEEELASRGLLGRGGA